MSSLMWIEKHQQRIRAVLEAIEKKGAQRHRELINVWMQNGGNGVSFNQSLSFLKRKGFVVKESTDKQSPYKLTDQGRKYLEGLKA